MNRLLIGCLFFLFGLTGLAVADDQQIGMVTGSQTGTYIQFGNDIAGVAKTVGLDILVKDSQGSIDNIKRINSKENATFGIVQSDVLGFLSRSESPEMRQVASRLRLIFPFYAEEVPQVIEALINVYVEQRAPSERFIDTVERLGTEPFKARAYAGRDRRKTAAANVEEAVHA